MHGAISTHRKATLEKNIFEKKNFAAQSGTILLFDFYT